MAVSAGSTSQAKIHLQPVHQAGLCCQANHSSIGSDTGVRMLFADLKAPTETSYDAKPVKDLLLAPKEEK